MQKKISLVAVDGSQSSLRAVQVALGMCEGRADCELRIINVQPALPLGLHAYFTQDQIQKLAQDSADEALADARTWLDAQGAPYTSGFRLGDPATEIVAEAQAAHCANIVMGSRGLGRLSGAILGSIAAKVVHLANVPVTLVK